ncbi:MAG: A24 family peptidase [Chloroflexota bacterium]|jgi:prepilin peptidase CpaA
MTAPIFRIENITAPDVLTGAILVGIMVAAVYTDLRFGRIPNALTLGMAALGLLLNLLFGGFEGGLASVEGWLLGAGLFFAFFALGAMGAGDVKLLAAVGAIKGPYFVFNAFIFTGLAGGAIALLVVLRRRQVGYLAASMVMQLQSLIYTGGIVRPSSRESSALRFPYGLAIAAGSIAALFWSL